MNNQCSFVSVKHHLRKAWRGKIQTEHKMTSLLPYIYVRTVPFLKMTYKYEHISQTVESCVNKNRNITLLHMMQLGNNGCLAVAEGTSEKILTSFMHGCIPL